MKSPPVRFLDKLKLREKTLLVLSLTLASLTGVVYLASSTILLGSLKIAEEQSARESLQGVLNLFTKDQEAFTARYSDWSAWDDTYQFIQDRNDAYLKSNLVPEQLASLKVNLALFVDVQGRIVYGTGFDLKTKQLQPIPSLPKPLTKQLLLEQARTNGPVTGIFVLPEGPMLMTCQPILTSEGKGPVRGVLIFGRYIDADAIANLSKITRFPLQLYSLKNSYHPPDVAATRSALSVQNPLLIHPLTETTLVGYGQLTDLNHQPALLLRIEIPRKLYQEATKSQQQLMLAIVLLGLTFGGITVFLSEQLVLARLLRLSSGVSSIRISQNLAHRLTMSGQDEISSLTHNINELLETLEQAQGDTKAALEQVTQSNGELQAAVEQLQGEIWERQRIEDALRQSEEQLRHQTQSLAQTLSELQQTQMQLVQSEKMSSLGQLVAGIAHEINNPVSFIYGNLEPAANYFNDLLQVLHLYQQEYATPTPSLQTALKSLDLEFVITDLPKVLTSMRTGAERIREIVTSLRTFSRLDEAEVKAVDIHTSIDSTLLLLRSRLNVKGSGTAIRVVKDYGQLPLVECYAGQLNQVFMNILTNAIQAIKEAEAARPVTTAQPSEASMTRADHPVGTITIRTLCQNDDTIEIAISDTGVGMSEAVRNRIFDPFFTTKPVGRGTGLGLSLSYQIIVKQHDGALACHSRLGQGTTFIITLPNRLP
ncbi:ATP-binding protein [Leptolyngbya sp. DQ-M1]|uniref:CHASE4 domain-containing protein n=1 Tax=Leptolyngbya sp. DQ-M1 TaxID=2933920 RepID=UPI003297B57D